MGARATKCMETPEQIIARKTRGTRGTRGTEKSAAGECMRTTE